jgi:hypothetical protein
VDTTYPDHSIYPIHNHSNWMELYPDAGKEMLADLSTKGPKVRMTFLWMPTMHIFWLC